MGWKRASVQGTCWSSLAGTWTVFPLLINSISCSICGYVLPHIMAWILFQRGWCLWLLSAPCQIPSVQSPGVGAPYRKHSSPCCSCVRCPPLLQHQFLGLQSLMRCLKACLKSMCQANLFTQSLGTLKWLYAWYRALFDLDIFSLFGHLFTIKSETLTAFFFGKLQIIFAEPEYLTAV